METEFSDTIGRVRKECQDIYEKIRQNQVTVVRLPIHIRTRHLVTIVPIDDEKNWENGDCDVTTLCRAILASTSVKKLYLWCLSLDDQERLSTDSYKSLTSCLSGCKNLEEVVFIGKTAGPVLPFLAMNKSIRRLTICVRQVEAATLANMFRTTTSLLRLEFRILSFSGEYRHYAYAAFSDDQLASIADACRTNQSITELRLVYFATNPLGRTLLSTLGPKLTRLELTGSCDGAAIGTFLRHARLLRVLQFDRLNLTRADLLAITEGLARNVSLREVVWNPPRDQITPTENALLGDMIRAASLLESFRYVAANSDSPQVLKVILESLSQLSNIRSVSLLTTEPIKFGPGLANLLQMNGRLHQLKLGCLHFCEVDDLARGLAASPSLVELDTRIGHVTFEEIHVLFYQGVCQCPTLERLSLEMRFCPDAANEVSRLVERNHTLRSLHLDFTDHGARVGAAAALVVKALPFNDALEELKVTGNFHANDEEVVSSLSFVLPQLRRLKTLHVRPCKDLEHFIHELNLNMSLTDFCVSSIYRRYDNDSSKVKGKREKIMRRNEALSASEYGQNAAPSLWPAVIHLALLNEHVGLSMVYGLLSRRSEVVALYAQLRMSAQS